MKFFVIAAQSPTVQQQNAITMLFRGKPEYGFWHWTSEFWILDVQSEAITSVTLRDMISVAAPGLSFAVFGLDPRPGDWAMLSDPKWSEWMEGSWPKLPG
jgi:hypothetical protein